MPGGRVGPVNATASRFAVLGALRAWRDDDEVDLGAPQQRALLAMLLVRAGSPVAMSEIIEVLWPHGAPATAVNVVQRYVSRLRRLLPADGLIRLAGGYRFDPAAAELDLLAFRKDRAAGRALSGHDPHGALDRMVAALSRWRGPLVAGIDETVRGAAMFVAVDRERAEAALQASALALRVGAGDRILPALRAVAAATPLDEVVQAALIRVLAATGRQAEALAHFTVVREHLADDLGVDPGGDLTSAHTEVLRIGTAGTRPARDSAPRPVTPAIRPAQLPGDLQSFAGRTEWLHRLSSLLTGAQDARFTVPIAAITGMGGVGKTTLAVHSAHRLAGDFPDGQLYTNLRGFDPSSSPVSAHEVLRGFLGALGVPEAGIPASFDDQVALYRSVLAGRRVLVVLDNVRDADHARPLLPGPPGSAAIVTSRNPLTGLVVREGALPVTLDLLSPAESRTLLARRLGRERTSQASAEVTRILDACGGLPLALALFAARASSYPELDLDRLADEVDDSRRRLDGFSRAGADHDLRAVFSWSYALLGDDTARLFRLLALHPGPTFGAPAAASLLGTDPGRADALLQELCRANLLIEHRPGRFRYHDLVRAYGAELLGEHEATAERDAAQRRLFSYGAGSVAHAAHLLDPSRRPPTPYERESDGVSIERIGDADEALEWLTSERPALLTMVDRAAAARLDRLVCHLVWGLESLLRRQEFWPDWERTQLIGLEAARRLGDKVIEVRVRYALGFLYSAQHLDDPGASEKHLQQALRLAAELRDHELHARVLVVVAEQRIKKGRPDEHRSIMYAAIGAFRMLELEDPERVPLDFVAYAHWRAGDLDNALSYAQRAVERLRGAGNHAEATAWHTLAGIHAGRHDGAAALAANHRACELYRALGDDFLEGLAEAGLGEALSAAGRHEAARHPLSRAIAILESLGSPKAAEARALLDALHAKG
ncbi:BTAD domain-containing putative transcriptional regulator [Actinoplanes sp. NPDC023714]|uniref:AfsR/SARP family transcriptional regulator n=1 Tax=Actinoplanes sp. NPDC023714 TaxID=3154322 RepID=UPI00340C7D3A